MSERLHALAQHLLGKSSVEECSIEELQHLTKRYPFFAPAQFLLLQKLRDTGSPEGETQHRKAVLYYHDPLQFDYFISSDKYHINEEAFFEKEKSETPVWKDTSVDEVKPAGHLIAEEQSFLQKDNVEETSSDNLTLDKPLEEEPTTVEQEEAKKDINTNFHQPDEIGEVDEKSTFLAALPPTAEEPAAVEEETRTEEHPGTEPAGENSSPTEKETELQAAPVQKEESRPVAASTGSVNLRSDLPAAPALTSSGTVASVKESPLTFEPYHTVDYFASQGIKISAEELPKDKLGKQLRSFTEWLRTMKRLPAAEIAKTPETSAEKNVENLASHSVVESDVVTETMAEVWAKQGNREKAMETYNKLSLLNPSKKAYFAAKIENLKQS